MEELHDRLIRSPTVPRLPRRSVPVLAWVVPLVVAAVVLLPMLPAHTQPTSPTGESTFFTTPAARAIPRGSVVLAYPYPNAPFIPAGPGGPSVYTFAPVNDVLLDQAVAGMPFKLVGGYGWRPTKGTYGSPRPSHLDPPTVATLFGTAFAGVVAAGQTALLARADLTTDLRSFLQRYHVGTVVVLPLGHDPATVVDHLTAAIGVPTHASGASVWFGVQARLRSTPTP